MLRSPVIAPAEVGLFARLATNKGTGLRLHDSCPCCCAAPHGRGACHGGNRCRSIHLEPGPSHQASDQEQAGGSCDHEAPLQRDQRAAQHLLDLLCELGLSLNCSVPGLTCFSPELLRLLTRERPNLHSASGEGAGAWKQPHKQPRP